MVNSWNCRPFLACHPRRSGSSFTFQAVLESEFFWKVSCTSSYVSRYLKDVLIHLSPKKYVLNINPGKTGRGSASGRVLCSLLSSGQTNSGLFMWVFRQKCQRTGTVARRSTVDDDFTSRRGKLTSVTKLNGELAARCTDVWRSNAMKK